MNLLEITKLSLSEADYCFKMMTEAWSIFCDPFAVVTKIEFLKLRDANAYK